jgi:hypothetical protein
MNKHTSICSIGLSKQDANAAPQKPNMQTEKNAKINIDDINGI